MLKVFTAFSGYDSQCIALDRLHDKPRASKAEFEVMDILREAGLHA